MLAVGVTDGSVGNNMPLIMVRKALRLLWSSRRAVGSIVSESRSSSVKDTITWKGSVDGGVDHRVDK